MIIAGEDGRTATNSETGQPADRPSQEASAAKSQGEAQEAESESESEHEDDDLYDNAEEEEEEEECQEEEVDWAEKAVEEKESGNSLYKIGKYTPAIAHYSAAVDIAIKQGFKDLELTFRLNRAAAYLMIRDGKAGAEDCEAVLAKQPDNVKALARCADCLLAMEVLASNWKTIKFNNKSQQDGKVSFVFGNKSWRSWKNKENGFWRFLNLKP